MMPVFRALAAYLVGCVPVARIVAGLVPDAKWSRVAFALTDFLKGLLAVLFLAPVGLGSVGQALVLTALVAGDQWPAWGMERGRLGFWVAAGGMSMITPIAPVINAVLWGVGFAVSGYFVIGRAVGLVLTWVLLGLIAGWPIGLIALPPSLMVLERSLPELRLVRSGEAPKHHWKSGG